jgi:hypothetical protein
MKNTGMLTQHLPAQQLKWDQRIDDQTRHRLGSVICEETCRACQNRFAPELKSLVLTGSLARDEATFSKEGADSWSVLGDAEFLLIFKESAPLPSRASLETVRRHVERLLRNRSLTCQIGLSAAHPAYLSKLRPHIYAYELRELGRALWGDAEILSLIPEFSPSEIPLEDAWRLLCNRMIEQLAGVERLATGSSALDPQVHYRTVKLYLAMATSFLLFSGYYAPTYREGSERLLKLAINRREGEQPFPLRDFAKRVEVCTRWKLSGDGPSEIGRSGFAESALTYAWSLWRWELASLTGAGYQLDHAGLMRHGFRLQPLSDRLRGWSYVLRRCGWHRSWSQWPRWGRLCLRASPRLWIYAAASELFSALPQLLDGGAEPARSVDWHAVDGWLPIRTNGPPGATAPWQLLASNIVRNYRDFLVETRA